MGRRRRLLMQTGGLQLVGGRAVVVRAPECECLVERFAGTGNYVSAS